MRTGARAFTLVELLTVVSIMLIMITLVLPSVVNLNAAGNITTAAYQVSDILQSARSYATANNTYVWVGFFEENASVSGVLGIGQIVISIVASADGTMIYNTGSPAEINPLGLTQINKLTKIANTHLLSVGDNSPVFPNGTGMDTGGSISFIGRPAISGTQEELGYNSTPNNGFSFRYPVGPGTSRQYTFTEMIEFNPRGEVRLDNSTNPLRPLVEIGLQMAHGAQVDRNNPNVVAIQIGGIAGNVTTYRR
jgi:type II secretory pathway pseudopilin PulG